MLTATSMFIEELERWLIAARSGDFGRARTAAEAMVTSGELLAIAPEFIACWRKHEPESRPEEVLRLISAFLACTAEVRKQAVAGQIRNIHRSINGDRDA